jgi:hypothetical protein
MLKISFKACLLSLLLLLVSLSAFAQVPPRTVTVTAATYTDKGQYDVYVMDATSNAQTLTLLAPAKRRQPVIVIKTDSTVNAVTVATAGTGATINGSSTYVLYGQYASAIFYPNGKSGTSGIWNVAATTPDENRLRYTEVSISSANITGTSAGQLGHANGYVLIAAPGAGKAIEFVSATVILDYSTAAYTGGGNVTVNYGGGGGALSGVVSAANSLGAAADKIAIVFSAVPTNNQLVANTGLNLVAASAFTQPGTAAGVVRVQVLYRIHTTGL